jgi:hypothetical protein
MMVNESYQVVCLDEIVLLYRSGQYQFSQLISWSFQQFGHVEQKSCPVIKVPQHTSFTKDHLTPFQIPASLINSTPGFTFRPSDALNRFVRHLYMSISVSRLIDPTGHT